MIESLLITIILIIALFFLCYYLCWIHKSIKEAPVFLAHQNELFLYNYMYCNAPGVSTSPFSYYTTHLSCLCCYSTAKMKWWHMPLHFAYDIPRMTLDLPMKKGKMLYQLYTWGTLLLNVGMRLIVVTSTVRRDWQMWRATELDWVQAWQDARKMMFVAWVVLLWV